MFPFRVRKDNKQVMDKLLSEVNVNKYILDLIDNDINSSILTIKKIKECILPVLANHNIHKVYLFGSYSRGEANSNSDVDIYCEKGDINDLFEHSGLLTELKEALNKEVDLVFFTDTMDDYFRTELEKDKIKLC